MSNASLEDRFVVYICYAAENNPLSSLMGDEGEPPSATEPAQSSLHTEETQVKTGETAQTASAAELSGFSLSPTLVYEQKEGYQSSATPVGTSATVSEDSPHASSETEARQDTTHASPTSLEGETRANIPLQSQEAAATSDKATETIDPHNPPPGMRVATKQTSSGRIFKVIGEIVYELGSDGSTLRRGSYREHTVSTIHKLVSTAADLRARWVRDEQRQEIIDGLGEEGVDLRELAYALHLMDVDGLDLLLHVVFQAPVITRAQRVERLRREHPDFFKRYEKNLLARAILDVILDKYVKGEAPDVSDDVGLLQVIALTDGHNQFELARPFADPATGRNVRTVLKELQTLLYNV